MICNLHFIFVFKTRDAVVPLVPELAKHTVSAQLLAGDVEDEDDGDGDEDAVEDVNEDDDEEVDKDADGDNAGLHKLCHPTIQDGSTWSKFGAECDISSRDFSVSRLFSIF